MKEIGTAAKTTEAFGEGFATGVGEEAMSMGRGIVQGAGALAASDADAAKHLGQNGEVLANELKHPAETATEAASEAKHIAQTLGRGIQQQGSAFVTDVKKGDARALGTDLGKAAVDVVPLAVPGVGEAGEAAEGASVAEKAASVAAKAADGASGAGASARDLSVAARSAAAAARAPLSKSAAEEILRAAASGQGYFRLGSATAEESARLGKEWVGPGAALSQDGGAWVSADGLRKYRPPRFKGKRGLTQSNFERRSTPDGEWTENGHLYIVK